MNTEIRSRKTGEPFLLYRSMETQKFQSNKIDFKTTFHKLKYLNYTYRLKVHGSSKPKKISEEINRFTGHTLIRHVSVDQTSVQEAHELKAVG